MTRVQPLWCWIGNWAPGDMWKFGDFDLKTDKVQQQPKCTIFQTVLTKVQAVDQTCRRKKKVLSLVLLLLLNYVIIGAPLIHI